MKRFHFALRSIAVLRAHQELRAREAFGLAIHTFVQAEQELATAHARMQAVAEAVTGGRGGVFSPAQEADRLLAFRRDWATEEQAARAVTDAERAMAQRRIEYTDAHRRLEGVRRLEEKARQAHRQDLAREEQKEFDEFAGRRWAGRTISV